MHFILRVLVNDFPSLEMNDVFKRNFIQVRLMLSKIKQIIDLILFLEHLMT